MKWPVLVVALALLLPLAEWMRRHPRYLPWMWTVIGLLPFAQSAVPQLNIYVLAWKDWPGFAKGINFTALDLFVIAAYFSLPRRGYRLPFVVSMALYFATVLLSAVQAHAPEATLFYAWQLARAFLVYAVVAKASTDARLVLSLLNGMAIGLVFESFIVLWERYVLHIVQPTGTYVHQNLFGMVSHFVKYPCFALLLVGYPGWQYFSAVAVGTIASVLTASRATIGLTGIGYVFLLVLSALRQWSLRKGLIALLGAVVIVSLIPVAWSSLNRRTGNNLRMGVQLGINPINGDYDERGAFENAAKEMVANNPMGVGANNFVYIANAQGYYERSGVSRRPVSRAGHVHNVYWLTAAETGYIGLIAFVAMLLRPMIVAFSCGWQYRGSWRGELLLGLGTALLIVYMHSFYEWIFLTIEVQYFFAISIGMVVGLAQQLGYWRRARAAPQPRAEPTFIAPMDRVK